MLILIVCPNRLTSLPVAKKKRLKSWATGCPNMRRRACALSSWGSYSVTNPNPMAMPMPIHNLIMVRNAYCRYANIDPARCKQWLALHKAASASLVDRKGLLAQAAADIEKEVHIVGATAIEDKLQKGVPSAISDIQVRCSVLVEALSSIGVEISKFCASANSAVASAGVRNLCVGCLLVPVFHAYGVT